MGLMQSLRHASLNKGILFLVCLFMLVVQFGHLHMHNHELADAGAIKVHVLGGQEHRLPHDESGEIDLQFDGLIAKAKTMSDFPAILAVIVLLLSIQTFYIFRQSFVIGLPRSTVFSLRPPSRASP